MRAFKTLAGKQISEEVASKFEEARQLSFRFNHRYYITSEGKMVPAPYNEEEVPENVAAYTWYQTRAKGLVNKWTIQVVG